MTGTTIPIILTIVAAILALSAYRGIRRGSARLYTLEREMILKRAAFTVLGSMLLFIAAVVLMVMGFRALTEPVDQLEPGPGEQVVMTATSEILLQTQPPTETPTSTPDPNAPTPTPTVMICRAVVEGTAGSGLVLREVPNGPEIVILQEGAILTLLDENPVEDGGFIWYKIRTVAQDEGWVVEDFITIGDCR